MYGNTISNVHYYHFILSTMTYTLKGYFRIAILSPKRTKADVDLFYLKIDTGITNCIYIKLEQQWILTLTIGRRTQLITDSKKLTKLHLFAPTHSPLKYLAE